MKSSCLNAANCLAQAIRKHWFLLAIAGLLSSWSGNAQGTAFTYQGSLADGGTPANGSYDLRLTVFDAATAGNAVGTVTELPGQTVSDGLFTVTLDPGAGVFAGSARWLELAVRTNGAADFVIIAPRQALTPTPYAIHAATAGSAATATVATTAGSVPAAGITGTLPVAQLPASVVVNGSSGLTLTKAPELVGQSSLAGGALSVLAGDHYAGIAAGNAGLLIFDVANPAAPVLVSQFNQGVITHAFTVDKDHAYLVSGANGLRTFSLTNIAVPEFLSETNDTTAQQVITDGNYAYVAGTPNTVVYSLADRSHPEKIAVVGAPSASPRRIALADTNLFVAGANALRVYSVATPASPVQLANLPVFGARFVAVSGSFACVACGPDGVAVFDVANPASPTLVGAVPADADAQHVYASANRLYVSDHGVGLTEWDISSPGASVRLHTFTSVPAVTGSIVLNNYAMTANSDAVGLRILGLSQAVNFAAGHAGNGASGAAVGVTIGGGGARTYLVQTGEGEQNVGGPNVAGGDFSTISGGLSNTVAQAAHGAVIGGGAFNLIGTNATVAFIGSGAGNRIGADSRNAVIAGGDNNSVGTNAPSATIGGGERNEIADNVRSATIPGGFENRVSGEYAFAAGQRAQAVHRGAFVWADSQGGDFTSTADNQFSVRAGGGVRFETGGAGVLVDGQPLGATGAARLNGGNTFTGNQTVNGSVTATSFAGNGFGLTSLNAANLTGTVIDARLSPNVPLLTAGKLNDSVLGTDVARRTGGNAFLGDQQVTGAVTATSLSGDGSGLTALNASSLGSGTVPDARLSANVATRTGANTFNGDQTITGAVAATTFTGDGAALTGLNAANLAMGTVSDTRLSANVPLLTAGKLNDSVLGTDVARRTGGNAFLGDQQVTGAVSATLVSGNGSGLTALNASTLGSGTVPDARLSANVATRSGGNTFTGNQNVTGSVTATGFAGGGAALTGLNASSLGSGTVPDGRLSANVPLLTAGKLNDSVLGTDMARRTGGNTFTGNQTVNGSVSATSVSGNGSGLTALNASSLGSGTVPDARLSANVPLLIGGNAFTGSQSIVAGTAEDPFPQLRAAAASTACCGAFVSVDATATSRGKDYFIYSTGGTAGEGPGKLVTKNQTDNRIIQTLTADGKVGLGSAYSPATTLHVKQRTDNGGFNPANDGLRLEAASGESWTFQTQAAGDLVFDSGSGSGYAYLSRNSGAFNITSDARFKRDIQPLGPLLDRVLELEPVTFRYLQAPADSPPVVGFIAQQVLPLFPEVVDEKDGQYAIGYDAFGPIAIGAIQELNAKLESRLAAKDAEVAALKARLEKLERLINEKLGGGQ